VIDTRLLLIYLKCISFPRATRKNRKRLKRVKGGNQRTSHDFVIRAARCSLRNALIHHSTSHHFQRLYGLDSLHPQFYNEIYLFRSNSLHHRFFTSRSVQPQAQASQSLPVFACLQEHCRRDIDVILSFGDRFFGTFFPFPELCNYTWLAVRLMIKQHRRHFHLPPPHASSF